MMDTLLCRPILTAIGERDPEALGMKEMKLAAAFLAKQQIEACNDDHPAYIQAGKYRWKTQEWHLAYCLVIPQFHYVGILELEDE